MTDADARFSFELIFAAADQALRSGEGKLASDVMKCRVLERGADATGRGVLTLGCIGELDQAFVSYSETEREFLASEAVVALLNRVSGAFDRVDLVLIKWLPIPGWKTGLELLSE